MDAVRSALNANGGGKIQLQTAGSAALVNVNLETVIPAASNGVLTVISTAKTGTATAAGTATQAVLTDGASTTVASGLTVGTSGADVILNDTALVIGSEVTLNSGTITSA
jgi:hypothetical protein